MKILVVGAGFTGASIARHLADNNLTVHLIDQRSHIGGNAWDYTNNHGIRVHAYGAHIFHTKNQKVFDWLSRFTTWIPYQHKVNAMLHDGRLVPFPPNRDTLKIVDSSKILDVFYKPYSEKMWGLPWEEISSSVINRVKPQEKDTDLYFPDHPIQALPENGYTRLFENMIDHDRIKVFLNTPFCKKMENEYDHCFNSMCIDSYYEESLGVLPYRSLEFHHVNLPFPKLFPVSVVNFTHNGPQTRVIEWKNFPSHGVNDCYTSITYETPVQATHQNHRFYPILDKLGENRKLYAAYAALPNLKTTFVGRLGCYVYIDMDQAVNQALAKANWFLNKKH